MSGIRSLKFSRYEIASLALGFSLLFSAPSYSQQGTVTPELLARMAKEKEDRRGCKVEICTSFAKPVGGNPITCTVTKTWLSDEIQTQILADKFTWPWGYAQCSTSLDLDRNAIKEAATKPEATLKLKKHDISCKLESKDPAAGTAYDVKLSIEPTITFAGGKAVKADMAWGKIEAPVLAKTALWTATTADQNFGVLSGAIVREVNAFLFEKCKEVGVEISSK